VSDDGKNWFGCPTGTDAAGECITLAHGEGGRLSRCLVRERLLHRFSNDSLRPLGDAALLVAAGRLLYDPTTLAFTTDGYTVSPLFFPGGDIGQLAVFGTVNDLAVSGATPRWLSLALIVEEGLPWTVFDRVLDSLQTAAHLADVTIVTGDTKVVPCGTADGLFITTSGIGVLRTPAPPGPQALQPGDVLIVSGPIGCHGAAILCAREQFDFDPPPASDCAPLTVPLTALYDAGITPRAMRDATRGGVAAVLHEWAEASGQSCTIEEGALPIRHNVRAVCELLGLDPLHLANEGTCVLATPPAAVEPTLEVLRRCEITQHAGVIGRIGPARRTAVSVIRATGREVPLDEPPGAPLPRIC
jgi:hydrogenase expression/formation protein HypE